MIRGISLSIQHQNTSEDILVSCLYEVSTVEAVLLVGDMLSSGLLNLRKPMSNYVALHRKHPIHFFRYFGS